MKLAMTAMLGLLFAPAAFAGEPVNMKTDTDANGSVSIDVTRGEVTIVAWSKNEVTVEGTRDDNSEEFVFRREDKTVYIEDEISHRRGRGNGTKITVHVPVNNDVKLEGVSTSVSVAGVKGEVGIEVVSGNVKAEKLGGRVKIETVSGNIDLKGGEGNISLEAVSGSVKAETSATRLNASSVSGDVEVINRAAVGHAEVSTVSGDLELTSPVSADLDLELGSISGDITFNVVGDLDAKVEVETGPGGRIDNRLNDVEPDRERFTGAETLRTKIGKGSGYIEASVISGRISLRRK